MKIIANRVKDGLLYADAEYSFLSNSRSQAAIPPLSCSLRAPSPDTTCREASWRRTSSGNTSRSSTFSRFPPQAGQTGSDVRSAQEHFTHCCKPPLSLFSTTTLWIFLAEVEPKSRRLPARRSGHHLAQP